MSIYLGTYPPSEGLSRTGDQMDSGADLLSGNLNTTNPAAFVSLQQCIAIAGGSTPTNTITYWDSTKTYTTGNVVIYNNSIWSANATNTNSPPTLINTNWICVAGIGYVKVTGGTMAGSIDSSSYVIKVANPIDTSPTSKDAINYGTLISVAGNNSVSTTLSAFLNATDTIALVTSATGFPAAGVILIGNEYISFSQKGSISFLNLTRGVNGSTASTHLIGSKVSLISLNYDSVVSGLTGDVLSTGITNGLATTQVVFVGNHTASDTATAVSNVQAATSQADPNTIVKRDSSGNLFAVGLITSSFVSIPFSATTSTQVPNLGQVQSLIASASGATIFSTLYANIGSSDNTISVNGDGKGFFPQGYLVIDSEVIFYGGINTVPSAPYVLFINCVRAKNSTTAATHTANTKVSLINSRDVTPLNPNLVMVSDGNGYPISGSATTQQLTYLDATSSIQTQLDNKLPLSGGTMTGSIDSSSYVIKVSDPIDTSATSKDAVNYETLKFYVNTGIKDPFYTNTSANIPINSRIIIAETVGLDIVLTMPSISAITSATTGIIPFRIIKLGSLNIVTVVLTAGDNFTDRSNIIYLYADSETKDISALVFKTNVWCKN